jgi:hypothetical protein
MSPSRSRSRVPVKRRRSRREVATAVGVALAIIVGTALAIWLLRPGDTGVPGTGGIANRQPRATWLVGGAILVGIVAVALIMSNPKYRRHKKAAIPAAIAIVLVVAIVVGIMWPGGLLRTYEVAEPPPPLSVPSSPQAPEPSATTAPVGTTGATPTTVPTQPPTTGG